MAGISDIKELLKSISPTMCEGEYVFCSVPGEYSDYAHLKPRASFVEPEGMTLIVTVEAANESRLIYEGVYKQITLTVHSSLDAVGLTAAVSTKLASYGISANVVAAYYHDHVFVQKEKASRALAALRELEDE